MQHRVIHKIKAVTEIVGLKTSTIYKLVRLGQFPQPIYLTAKSVGWDSLELQHWIDLRRSAR